VRGTGKRRKNPVRGPSMKRLPRSMCDRFVCILFLSRSQWGRSRRQAWASFYRRSKRWRSVGRRRIGGVARSGTPSIFRCSLGTRGHVASHAPSGVARRSAHVRRVLCHHGEADGLVHGPIAPDRARCAARPRSGARGGTPPADRRPPASGHPADPSSPAGYGWRTSARSSDPRRLPHGPALPRRVPPTRSPSMPRAARAPPRAPQAAPQTARDVCAPGAR